MEQANKLEFFKMRKKNLFSNIIVALKAIIGKVVDQWAQLEKSCNDLLEKIKS
jgi:hypothetical protein